MQLYDHEDAQPCQHLLPWQACSIQHSHHTHDCASIAAYNHPNDVIAAHQACYMTTCNCM